MIIRYTGFTEERQTDRKEHNVEIKKKKYLSGMLCKKIHGQKSPRSCLQNIKNIAVWTVSHCISDHQSNWSVKRKQNKYSMCLFSCVKITVLYLLRVSYRLNWCGFSPVPPFSSHSSKLCMLDYLETQNILLVGMYVWMGVGLYVSTCGQYRVYSTCHV